MVINLTMHLSESFCLHNPEFKWNDMKSLRIKRNSLWIFRNSALTQFILKTIKNVLGNGNGNRKRFVWPTNSIIFLGKLCK